MSWSGCPLPIAHPTWLLTTYRFPARTVFVQLALAYFSASVSVSWFESPARFAASLLLLPGHAMAASDASGQRVVQCKICSAWSEWCSASGQDVVPCPHCHCNLADAEPFATAAGADKSGSSAAGSESAICPSFHGRTADQHDVDLMMNNTQVICEYCKTSEDMSRVRSISKKKGTWKCNRCHSKIVILYKSFGRWPPADWNSVSEDDKVAFFRSVEGRGDLGGKARRLLAGVHESMDHFESGGEYLPLSVWVQRGFDGDRIERFSKDSDKDECDVLGKIYRVPIRSKRHTVSSGNRYEDRLDSHGFGSQPVVLQPKTPAPRRLMPPSHADDAAEQSSSTESWDSDWSMGKKQKRIKRRCEKRMQAELEQVKTDKAKQVRKEKRQAKKDAQEEREALRKRKADAALAERDRKQSEGAQAAEAKRLAKSAAAEAKKAAATAAVESKAGTKLATSMESTLRTAIKTVTDVLADPKSAHIPSMHTAPIESMLTGVKAKHLLCAQRMTDNTVSLPFADMKECKAQVDSLRKIEALIMSLQKVKKAET